MAKEKLEIKVLNLRLFSDWQKAIQKYKIKVKGKISKNEKEYFSLFCLEKIKTEILNKYNMNFENIIKALPDTALNNNPDKNSEYFNAILDDTIKKAIRYNFRIQNHAEALEIDLLLEFVIFNFFSLLDLMSKYGFVYENILKYAYVINPSHLLKKMQTLSNKTTDKKKLLQITVAHLNNTLSNPNSILTT